MTKAGAPIEPGPPGGTSVAAPPAFIADWVRQIRADDQQRGGRSVAMYILDNEPALWNSTHRDLHPAPVSYDELLERTLAYGSQVRQADPKAVIAGPAEWGWPAYFYSAVDSATKFRLNPDRLAHGNVPLLAWYLGKLHDHQTKTGERILDVLDVHYYPMADRVGGTNGGTDAKTAALRLRSTRGLWDPTYVDESWIGEPVQLIPRLKKLVAENDPGVGISIGEWNFGAELHISGGLAVAEALGRFGQQGIQAAFYWTYPPNRSPAFWAFRAYRNFDGKGGHFLSRSVPTVTPEGTSLFASRDESGTHVVLVALNLKPDSDLSAKIDLERLRPGGRRPRVQVLRRTCPSSSRASCRWSGVKSTQASRRIQSRSSTCIWPPHDRFSMTHLAFAIDGGGGNLTYQRNLAAVLAGSRGSNRIFSPFAIAEHDIWELVPLVSRNLALTASARAAAALHAAGRQRPSGRGAHPQPVAGPLRNPADAKGANRDLDRRDAGQLRHVRRCPGSQGSWPRHRGCEEALDPGNLQRCGTDTGVLAVGEGFADQRLPLPGRKGGRDSAGHRRRTLETRTRLAPQIGGPIRILFTGGNFERKGGPELLRWKELTRHREVELHLVTQRPVPELPGVVVHRDLTPNAPELVALAQLCDLFVLPTRGDCFGFAVIEAQAVGLPVVVSDVGGIRDIVVEGETGFLVARGDFDALCDRIDRLVEDSELRRKMGVRGREVAVERFDARRNAQRVLDLMLQMAGSEAAGHEAAGGGARRQLQRHRFLCRADRDRRLDRGLRGDVARDRPRGWRVCCEARSAAGYPDRGPRAAASFPGRGAPGALLAHRGRAPNAGGIARLRVARLPGGAPVWHLNRPALALGGGGQGRARSASRVGSTRTAPWGVCARPGVTSVEHPFGAPSSLGSRWTSTAGTRRGTEPPTGS